jgi:hypothetical protein
MQIKPFLAAVFFATILATAQTTTPAKPAAKSTASEVQKPPQAGMVWANTKSKIYHKEGDQWYGKGKNGKWMTEADAKKAGYNAAKASATAPKTATK